MNRREFLTGMTLPAGLAMAAPAGPAFDRQFRNPPPSARPWVYWFWINGNISKEGVTADLESMREAGVGGVLWMEVSGPWWAPDGPVQALTPAWTEAIQWAIVECQRLGLEFDLSLDFGYGSGGPHITPDLSMQQLVWSETPVEGGRRVEAKLARAELKKNVSAWLRPGANIGAAVLDAIEHRDSYRDVAVLAIPAPAARADRLFRIPRLVNRNGLHWTMPPAGDLAAATPPGAVAPLRRVVDLTGKMDRDGRITWDAPAGSWIVLRYGHASNFKMTRPCPSAAVGLECDRLSKAGVEAHYQAFLKKLFVGAGKAAGNALAYVHIDSWEAGGQNWCAEFPVEFRRRRGYNLRPWLPVLAGRVVESPELTERFLWDVRVTVSEMIRQNYALRLKELARTHGVKLSIEAYGHLCIDNLAYAGAADMPISEFWARGEGKFPSPGGYETSSKAMASAAHVYGRTVVGAEAFTSDRGWRDHPYLLKAMGDKAFCRGVNRFIFHLSAHQAYPNMIPGLTHRRWGQHIHRYNTWWNYSRPWMDYLARCQYLLQSGHAVADVCYWFGEGAPLPVEAMDLAIPEGYDYDLCSTEIVEQLHVRGGMLVAPSGASYRYLLLPSADRITPALLRKLKALAESGARIVGGEKPVGAPGLAAYPDCDREVERHAAWLWDGKRVIDGRNLAAVFRRERLAPDFEGAGLLYLHRRIGVADVYFVSNQEERTRDQTCVFRIAGRRPELWDPETGDIRALPEFAERDGRISIPLRFLPMQSWFVVFRPETKPAARGANFTEARTLRPIEGEWRATFDPKWGGPDGPVAFARLEDWSRHPDERVRYYSGTARYRTTLSLSAEEASGEHRLLLDLGAVEAMARVWLNGKECGVAWKPPYRVDVTDAARAGENLLEIDVVNLWINRMIGDERLPEDSNWKDFETLLEWPEWFKTGKPRPSGRYTFTSCRHYKKDTPLAPSGLLGPVTLKASSR
jgi:hypothetical protein